MNTLSPFPDTTQLLNELTPQPDLPAIDMAFNGQVDVAGVLPTAFDLLQPSTDFSAASFDAGQGTDFTRLQTPWDSPTPDLSSSVQDFTAPTVSWGDSQQVMLRSGSCYDDMLQHQSKAEYAGCDYKKFDQLAFDYNKDADAARQHGDMIEASRLGALASDMEGKADDALSRKRSEESKAADAQQCLQFEQNKTL